MSEQDREGEQHDEPVRETADAGDDVERREDCDDARDGRQHPADAWCVVGTVHGSTSSLSVVDDHAFEPPPRSGSRVMI